MEYYSKTIRVLEPYGGWIVNYHDTELVHENLDTGLGNRLFHWLNAYRISEKYNFEYKILVEKIWWPELEYIELPNTIWVDSDFSFENYNEIKNDFIKGASPITNTMFNAFIDGKSILDKNHWFTDFDYTTFIYPFPKIKLKFDFNFDFKNTLGVHIRRGNGIEFPKIKNVYKDGLGVFGKVTKDDCEITEWKSNFTLNNTDTPYIPNEYYYKWIDSFLNQNKKNKIYISTDVPNEFLKPFYVKYGNKIITKEKLISNYKYNNLPWPYGKTFENIIDLFSLSSCDYLIEHPNSSWSFFSKMYSNLEFPKLNVF